MHPTIAVMARGKGKTIPIKLLSSAGTGFFYTTRKNVSNTQHKIAKPLGDPLGGTELANGRHQIKLFEPEAKSDSPPAVPVILLGSLQFSDACLRTYAHPELLKVAEAINALPS